MASDASVSNGVTIDPPDADGDVWLHQTIAGMLSSINLGKRDEVREMFSQWLAMVETEDGY